MHASKLAQFGHNRPNGALCLLTLRKQLSHDYIFCFSLVQREVSGSSAHYPYPSQITNP